MKLHISGRLPVALRIATPPARRIYAVAAAAIAAGLAPLSTALAEHGNSGINGIFRATSNGDWAKTNEVYRDQTTVVSTWTINSSCISPDECAGQVVSDSGWTAEIFTTNGLWYVKRTVGDWQHCSNGTVSAGAEVYTFYPVDAHGQVLAGSDTFAGQHTTTGESGACGVNLPVAIRMPFSLVKID